VDRFDSPKRRKSRESRIPTAVADFFIHPLPHLPYLLPALLAGTPVMTVICGAGPVSGGKRLTWPFETGAASEFRDVGVKGGDKALLWMGAVKSWISSAMPK
jgi:hypothetical protein